jgi:hypothetical protein
MAAGDTIKREVKEITPSYGELKRQAFSLICNPDDWKAPIDCEVPFHAASFFHEVIVYVTGTVPESEKLPNGNFRMTSIGYRMGPCGDY